MELKLLQMEASKETVFFLVTSLVMQKQKMGQHLQMVLLEGRLKRICS